MTINILQNLEINKYLMETKIIDTKYRKRQQIIEIWNYRASSLSMVLSLPVDDSLIIMNEKRQRSTKPKLADMFLNRNKDVFF